MQLEKNDIDFKYDFTEIEGIDSNIFPHNFICTIIGKPGSGKTTLLRQMLLNPQLLFKKYEHVIIISPSIDELPFIINPGYLNNKFDLPWIFKLLNTIISKTPINILIIIDDFVSQIKKLQFNPLLTALFFNRRHIVPNATISIILTSQRYMTIPPQIRSCINILIIFTLTHRDIQKIWEEHITISKKEFNQLANYKDKDSFLICNLHDNLFFLKFDRVVFSQS